ncbi:hypothetical protein WS62_08595 [Burkholderia sp. ABCPW 14]|nr:hypothetical protein WS62_08595 [Burkholderia sp. ABCPW 14]
MRRSTERAMRAMRVAAGACVAATLVQAVAGDARASATLKQSPYSPVSLPRHAKTYYQLMKGVDDLHVRRTASGNLIRFSYRVTDPAAARLLGDKSAAAYLYGETSHALLEIPVMDKIGQLRQSGPLEAGRAYWMVFSNKGELIKPGERVDIFVGPFHVDRLTVE